MENFVLEEHFPYQFRERKLLTQALTHKSFANEKALFYKRDNKVTRMDNERLEFLGDAVLDLAMTELLMKHFPLAHEGELSKKRASLVNENILSGLAKNLRLDRGLRLGRGEEASGGRSKPRLLACAMEALIGAVFTESGYETAKNLIFSLYEPVVANYEESDRVEEDYKTKFQEYSQKHFKMTPVYEIFWSFGPSHNRQFFSQVFLNGKWITRATGKSKKQAEQRAARNALEVLGEL
jgi:ribonuclease-3